MLVIEGTRFGRVEVDPRAVIRFPQGVVGFPEATSFVLLEPQEGKMIAYLQSVDTPGLAFPIADGVIFGPAYPQPSVETLAGMHGLGGDDLALMVIVAVNPQSKNLEANLLAPIIVDVGARKGAQVVLDARKFSAQVPLAITTPNDGSDDPIAEAKRRIAAIRARTHGTDEKSPAAARF